MLKAIERSDSSDKQSDSSGAARFSAAEAYTQDGQNLLRGMQGSSGSAENYLPQVSFTDSGSQANSPMAALTAVDGDITKLYTDINQLAGGITSGSNQFPIGNSGWATATQGMDSNGSPLSELPNPEQLLGGLPTPQQLGLPNPEQMLGALPTPQQLGLPTPEQLGLPDPLNLFGANDSSQISSQQSGSFNPLDPLNLFGGDGSQQSGQSGGSFNPLDPLNLFGGDGSSQQSSQQSGSFNPLDPLNLFGGDGSQQSSQSGGSFNPLDPLNLFGGDGSQQSSQQSGSFNPLDPLGLFGGQDSQSSQFPFEVPTPQQVLSGLPTPQQILSGPQNLLSSLPSLPGLPNPLESSSSSAQNQQSDNPLPTPPGLPTPPSPTELLTNPIQSIGNFLGGLF